MPVAKPGRDRKPPLSLQRHGGYGRINFKARQLGLFPFVLDAIGRAAFYPGEDRLVVFGVLLEPLAATVRRDHGGLSQQQTPFRVADVHTRDAFALHLGGKDLVGAAFGDPLVVIFWIKSVGRKLEAAATLNPAMAGRLIAAALGKNAADIAREAKRTGSARALDANGGLRLSFC